MDRGFMNLEAVAGPLERELPNKYGGFGGSPSSNAVHLGLGFLLFCIVVSISYFVCSEGTDLLVIEMKLSQVNILPHGHFVSSHSQPQRSRQPKRTSRVFQPSSFMKSGPKRPKPRVLAAGGSHRRRISVR